MSKCGWCKEPLGNRMVVMADDSILCYTCGRLRADQKHRSIQIFTLTVEALGEREAK